MDPADILDKAAVEVGKGWTDGQFADCHGNVCSYGAIARVMYGDAKHFTNHSGLLGLEANREDSELAKVTGALRKVMAEQFAACLPDDHTEWDAYGLITAVNDDFAEQKDVVACMQKAAVSLREKINLETNWHQTPELAYAEMNCAAMTLMHGG